MNYYSVHIFKMTLRDFVLIVLSFKVKRCHTTVCIIKQLSVSSVSVVVEARFHSKTNQTVICRGQKPYLRF